jgi:GNAT superfamily N-acetyltransferase
MEFRLLGWPADGPTLRLDHRRFAYAGKFVMSNTGKAVVREDADAGTSGENGERTEATDEGDRRDRGGERGGGSAEGGDADGSDGFDPDAVDYDDGVVAAVSFNEDRTDAGTLWIRYVTVRQDRRAEGLGARLCEFVAAKAAERGYERLRIAVNNPFAYEALHKAGFGWTGETTGLAELVLERPAEAPATVDRKTYQRGLDEYRERETSDSERRFLDARDGADPPPVTDATSADARGTDDGDAGR